MIYKDVFGNELHLGDYIATITSGGAVVRGPIIRFGKGRATIDDPTHPWKETRMIDYNRAFKVVAP
jgi:hypothetical protein